MYLIRWKKIRSQEHMKFDKDGRNKMQKKEKRTKKVKCGTGVGVMDIIYINAIERSGSGNIYNLYEMYKKRSRYYI